MSADVRTPVRTTVRPGHFAADGGQRDQRPALWHGSCCTSSVSVTTPPRSELYRATARRLSRLADRAAAAAETRTTAGLVRYQALAAKARPLREIVEALDLANGAFPVGSATRLMIETELDREVFDDVAAAIVEEAACARAWAEQCVEARKQRAADELARAVERAAQLAYLDRLEIRS